MIQAALMEYRTCRHYGVGVALSCWRAVQELAWRVGRMVRP